MTADEHNRAAILFDKICALPDNEHGAALEAGCEGDANIRAEVMRLLSAHRQVSDRPFLAGNAFEDAAQLIGRGPNDLPVAGTLLGNYRLGERIGAGGMGVVFEAQDMRLHRRVAVKVLGLQFVEEEEWERIRRFQREARIASLLNHPNIVSIYDAEFEQTWCYVAMEFVDGKTLRQLIQSDGGLPAASEIVELISQIASALSAAHQAGIVHRDIKPENIMLRNDGFVKVLDFGLASVPDAVGVSARGSDLRTRPGLLAGTVQYLSPEQILGSPASARSDLFGLGVVAYELATGVRPFEGATEGAVINSILNHTPPPPSAVRASLGTGLDGLIMRALEKDPELRFQTGGDLRSSCRVLTRDYIVKTSGSDLGIPQKSTSVESVAVPVRARPTRRWPWLLAAIIAAVTAVTFFQVTRPPPPLNVSRIVQVTNDGETKQRFVNDGTRLYYAEGTRDPDMKVFQANIKGGEPTPMPRLTGMLPLDISPDRSEIMLGQVLKGVSYHGTTDGPFPLWIADTLGNSRRRVGDLVASDARWSTRGDQILFSNGPELRTAQIDGSQSHIVAKVKGLIRYPEYSPDGRSIRFTVDSNVEGGGNGVISRMIWEVASDGGELHPLFSNLADDAPQSGTWTHGGDYFVFASGRSDVRDLWAVYEKTRLFGRGSAVPLRLTAGPMKANLPQAGKEGHRVFFLGQLNNGQLIRYDRRANAWEPYLGGIPAMQVDFSRDRKWLTYVKYPEGTVWRMALDGSNRLQLTTGPLFALNPRWSPDGTQIAYYGSQNPGDAPRLFMVPASGGKVLQLTHGDNRSIGDADLSWSADGASMVFGANLADQSVDPLERQVLELFDIKSQQVSKLPDSEGLWSPRWSPDGQFIAALGPGNRLWLYDVKTQKRRQLTTIGTGWPLWSEDSEFVYFEDNPGVDWQRVRISDRKVQRVMSLASLKMAPLSLSWVGTAPDGSPIATSDVGGTEIYELDWDEQ